MPEPGERSTDPSRARGPVTEAERQRMREFASEGLSVRQIATKVGRSTGTVSRVVSDLNAERREQTAAATQARTVDLAEFRTKLIEQTMRATHGALGRWAGVEHGDHRGSVDEARSFQAMVSALARLDELDTRARAGRDTSDVAAWHEVMKGRPSPEALAQLAEESGS